MPGQGSFRSFANARAVDDTANLPAGVADLKSAGTAASQASGQFGGCERYAGGVGPCCRRGGRKAPGAGPASLPCLTLGQRPDQGNTLWEDPACLVGGIFIPACGRGRRVEGGYVLSGRWPLVSGVNTSDWCLFAAFTEEDGVDVDRYYALPRSQIEIVDTWRSVGLKGSASNDVVVSEVFVPEHRTLSIRHLKGGPTPGNAHNRSPLYRTPSYCIFGIYISAAVLGIAESGLEFYLEGARRRIALTSRQKVGGYPTQQVKVAEASAALAAARQLLFSICDEASGIAPRRPAERRAPGEVPLACRLRWTAGGPRCRAAVGRRRQQQRSNNPMSRLSRHQRRRPTLHTELGRQRPTHGRVLMGSSWAIRRCDDDAPCPRRDHRICDRRLDRGGRVTETFSPRSDFVEKVSPCARPALPVETRGPRPSSPAV
jgi:hypothetical protein